MTAGAAVLAGCILFASLVEAQPQPLLVPPGVQELRLIRRVPPEYPTLAKQARIEGMVRLATLIGEGGEVQRLKLISGHPLLVKAAFDAVKQWRYRPTTRNGVQVPVCTIVEIGFTVRRRPVAAPVHVSGVKPPQSGDEESARERSRQQGEHAS